MRRNKRAMAMPLILQILIFLIVLGVVYFLIIRFTSGAADLTNQCTALDGRSLYVPDACNPDVSFENKLVERKEIAGTVHVCCSPLPGQASSFDNAYSQYKDSELNYLDARVGTAPTSSVVSDSGYTRVTPQNSEVQFFVNGDEIEQTFNVNYEEGMPPNAQVLKNSQNLFRVDHTFTDGAYCTLKMRPIYAESSGRIRFVSLNDQQQQYNFVTTSVGCDSPLQLPIKAIRTLEETGFAEPGFYKIEFVQWNNEQEQQVLQVASAIIQVSETTDVVGVQTPSTTDTILIKPIKESARNNIVTCIFAPYMASDDRFPNDNSRYLASDASQAPETYPNTFDNSGFFSLQEPGAGSQEPYVHIYLEEQGATRETSFAYTQCDYVDVFSAQAYEANYGNQCQQTACSEFSKSECRNPADRSLICDQEIQNCYWDKATTIDEWFDNDGMMFEGDCKNCGAISSCNQYDDAASCNSNQCLGQSNMDQRCFWNTQGQNNCRQCNYQGSAQSQCGQYLDEDSCTQDFCQFQERSNAFCTWTGSQCTSS
jgi:hypothetical protein